MRNPQRETRQHAGKTTTKLRNTNPRVQLRNMTNRAQRWFEQATHGASALQAAKDARPPLNNATLSRQLAKGRLTAEVVIALARGYGHSPIDALAQNDYITQEEATRGITDYSQILTDQDLIRELARRIDHTPGAWDDTFTHTLEQAQDADLYQLPHIADSSDTEPEPGDDDYHDGP